MRKGNVRIRYHKDSLRKSSFNPKASVFQEIMLISFVTFFTNHSIILWNLFSICYIFISKKGTPANTYLEKCTTVAAAAVAAASVAQHNIAQHLIWWSQRVVVCTFYVQLGEATWNPTCNKSVRTSFHRVFLECSVSFFFRFLSCQAYIHEIIFLCSLFLLLLFLLLYKSTMKKNKRLLFVVVCKNPKKKNNQQQHVKNLKFRHFEWFLH